MRRWLSPGTKIGLVVCIVPVTLILLGILWFVVWGGHQRRTSAEAAQQFLEDLLVAERVPLAYQRCSSTFRKIYPEHTLRRYALAFPRLALEDLTLIDATMSAYNQEGQVRFSCRFQSTRHLVIIVNLSKSNGAWVVDGFAIWEP